MTVQATSLEALSSVQPVLNHLQARVLWAIRQHGPCCDEAIVSITGMGANSVRPRRVELVALRLVRDSGRKALTASGRRAIAWEVSP